MNHSDNGKYKCRVCRKEIEIGARKCIHCNSYQNWRRYLGVSSSMISLFIALISVTALSGKHIQDLFESDYSEIGAFVAKATPESVLIVVANTGNKTGAILKGEFIVRGFRKLLSRELHPTESHLLEAGQIREISLKFQEPALSLQDVEGLKDHSADGLDYLDCTLEVSLLQYQSMDEIFSDQKRDMKRLRKERELRRTEEKAASRSIAMAKYGSRSDDSIFLDINCDHLFAK